MMFDTHAHLCSAVFTEEDFSQIVARAQSVGVEKIVNIATSPDELKRAKIQKKECPWLLIAAATTPGDVMHDEEFFPFFEKAAEVGELIAIGETGLDYTYTTDRELQKKTLIRYIHLAKRLSLPLIIHCREAFADLFSLLEEHYQENGKFLPGLLHCFTGSEEEAGYLINKGWLLSCSGIVTFKKSAALRNIFQKIPIEHIVIETDAPYLAPGIMRGKRNEPSYIVETAKMLAELKGLSLQELTQQLTKNSTILFSC